MDSQGNPHAVSRILLLGGFLAGPIIWSLHLVASEVLISAACSSGVQGFKRFALGGVAGWELLLLVVSLLFLLLALISDFTALHCWHGAHARSGLTGEAGGEPGRSSWMAMAGMLLNSFFLVGILAAAASIFWLSGCGG